MTQSHNEVAEGCHFNCFYRYAEKHKASGQDEKDFEIGDHEEKYFKAKNVDG